MGRGYYRGIIRITCKYPRSVYIIQFFWVCLHSVDIIHISWIYPLSVDIILISWIYPHFVDTIPIDHIMSYLARNIYHVLYSFVLAVDIIFGRITSYIACNVHPISHILLI